MSGFSPEWLALREPADHRSRSGALMGNLAARFGARESIAIVDLGCGSGSNLRATAPLLPITRQNWTLVDYDARLLAAARVALARWGDTAVEDTGGGGALRLSKGKRQISVTFRQADLVADLDRALGERPDLVTASAFFDLCSGAFIAQLADAVARRRSAFFTVLTYNGWQRWQPAHPADAVMNDAFHAHQATDKGFGSAAGPDAPALLAKAFRDAGYAVVEGDSPWLLGPDDAKLIGELATGFAVAVRETGKVAAGEIASWLKLARTHATVGHTDTLCLPPASS